ncbi:MAG: HNH endonuclease [Clostridium butyricum]|uniref:HNH endonuclease n=1 Tax=Clostridium sp. TaxID=1506 RepID=UPI0028FF1EA9|nr:HNH endonuclease [Clostridium sp.]MDU1116020.1 HNH endonuclease [Clostridium sp.]MDU7712373.1 HNH endonuclease [Clostridium butyricum]
MRGWIQANIDPKSKQGYNLHLAYRENDVLPWNSQGVLKGYKKDDIVFIIVKDNDKNKVMYKSIILEDSADISTTIDDSIYYYNQLTREENAKNRIGTCFLLKKLQYINDDRLYMKILKEQGFTKREYEQGSTKDKNPKNIPLFNYLDVVFNEYIDDEYTKEIYVDINKIKSDSSKIEEKYKEDFIKARIGQSKFREALIKKHGCKCSVCGLDIKEILIASHIKEYANCKNNEHIDLQNGLLLCANHDKLFDKHLISFDAEGKIIISDSISLKNYDSLEINESTIIDKELFKEEYMSYHRDRLK